MREQKRGARVGRPLLGGGGDGGSRGEPLLPPLNTTVKWRGCVTRATSRNLVIKVPWWDPVLVPPSPLSLPFGLLIVGGTRNSCDDEDDVVPLGGFH